MSTPPWPSLYDPGIDLINIPHNAPVQPGGAYLTHPVDIFRFTLYWTLIFYCPAFILCGTYAFWNLNFPPAPRPHNARSTPESGRPPKHGRGRGQGSELEIENSFWPRNSGAYPLSPLKPASAMPKPKPKPPPTALPSTSSTFPTSSTFRSTTPFITHANDPTPHINPSPGQQADPTSPPTAPSVTRGSPPPTPKPKYQYKERERRTRFTFALLVLLTFFAAGLAGAVLGSAVVGFVAAAFYSSAHYHMSTWIPFLLAVIMVLLGYLRSVVLDLLLRAVAN